MPSFAAQAPNLHAVGPVVELQLAVGTSTEDALRAAGRAVPAPVTALGMIDTGATGSVVQAGLLVLPNNVVFEATVIEAPLQGQHIQCLLGRDVLAHSVLVYIGYSNLFSLSF